MTDKIVVGTSPTRLDVHAKVTGQATYCVDIGLEGMAHAVVVRSERAHAIIRNIDTTVACSMQGVAGIVTGHDLRELYPRFGHIIPDHYILAVDKVRYYGEPVAIVIADTMFEAFDAAQQVIVTYEDLPAMMTTDEALAEDAPLIHDRTYQGAGDASFAVLAQQEDVGSTRPRSNVAHEVTIGWGDVDKAFEDAFVVVESQMKFPMLYAYAMEPYNAVASFVGDSLEVHTTAQHPFMVRDDLARIFSLPLSKVRVSVPFVGGGYGSKSYTKVEPMAAVASWVTGRPVKLVLSVEEAIYTTRVDAAVVNIRSSFRQDGTLTARDISIVMDSGAYADNSPMVIAKSVNRSFGPYRVPNLRVSGLSVYTNSSPASSYRGFGAPQGALAGETNLDRAADILGLDRLEIRRRNLVRPGEEVLPGKRGMDADLVADIDMIVASLEQGRNENPRGSYGVGFACSASDAGAYPVSTAAVRISTDGSVTVATGSTEMGQGSRTALAMIAAEELGVGLSMVQTVQSDTGLTPYERTTGASRTTAVVGLAVQRACIEAREKLAKMAAELFACDESDVVAHEGSVVGPEGVKLEYGEVVKGWFGANAGEVTGIGIVRRDGVTAKLPSFWEIGMVGVAVDVDTDTGKITLDQLVTVADVGYAVNPAAVHGQDLGAATQGVGMALFEELIYDGSQLVNPNVVEYRVPRVTDLARRIDCIIAERHDGIGPYGAKGSGEGALNPIAAAMVSALHDATGVWATEVPLTPERVWRMLGSGSR